jgi:hypothetical protein
MVIGWDDACLYFSPQVLRSGVLMSCDSIVPRGSIPCLCRDIVVVTGAFFKPSSMTKAIHSWFLGESTGRGTVLFSKSSSLEWAEELCQWPRGRIRNFNFV